MPTRTLFLIDGSNQMYRAYHAIRGLTGPTGKSTNAVYGFVTMLRKLLADHRPEYIAAYETMANLATAAGTEGGRRLRIHTPLIDLTKAQIIRTGLDRGVDFSITVSCYEADQTGAACGRCDSCLLRRKGFADAGIVDPTRYVADRDSVGSAAEQRA